MGGLSRGADGGVYGGVGLSLQSLACRDSLELLLVHRALYGGTGEIVGSIVGQQCEYPADVLVGSHSKYDVLVSVFGVAELMGQVFPSSRVVAGVADEVRVLFRLFPPSAQLRQCRDLIKGLRYAFPE